jgi:hypothetical protein
MSVSGNEPKEGNGRSMMRKWFDGESRPNTRTSSANLSLDL